MTEYLVVDHLSRKDIRRIFSKIKVDPVTGCWEWIGALNTYGYGEIWFNGGMEQSHRLLFAWADGPIPKGVGPAIPNLDHLKCDNPPCCNPAHLILALPRDNAFRGNNISSANAKKTHCKHGHLLPIKPNRPDGSGRRCDTCMKERSAEYYRNVARPRQMSARLAKRLAQPPKPILTEEERKEKNRQYHRAWRERNREAQRKYHHEYYEQKHQAAPLP